MKQGKYVYKNKQCEKQMHAFYDKTLAAQIFSCPIKRMLIHSRHLPSENTMRSICRETIRFSGTDLRMKYEGIRCTALAFFIYI